MFLFISPRENASTVFLISFEILQKKCENITFFYFYRFIGKVLKDGRSRFLANLSIIELFQKSFWSFRLLSRNIYLNEHYLVAVPASTEKKHALGKHCVQTNTTLPPPKTPNYIVLFISPDYYYITVNRKENPNVSLLLMFYISRKQPPASAC